MKPMENITIRPYNHYFKDTYQTQLLKLEEKGLTIKIPLFQNKPILMGVGTLVEIMGEHFSYTGEILERNIKKGYYLLTKPQGISRGRRQFGQTEVVAITSGKGGVGKSTILANLGILLSLKGERVSLIDGDLGSANLDILLRLPMKDNLGDVIRGEKGLLEIAVEGPAGILLIPGGSGFQELTKLKDWQFSHLINSFNQLEEYSNFIFIDTSAGLGENTTNFLLAADQIIVITTPEPHSMTDAYAIIKVISQLHQDLRIGLLINQVENLKEGEIIGKRMKKVIREYLSLEVNPLGSIHYDHMVQRAVKEQKPFVLKYPSCKASLDMNRLIPFFLEGHSLTQETHEIKKKTPFIERLKDFFSRNT